MQTTRGCGGGQTSSAALGARRACDGGDAGRRGARQLADFVTPEHEKTARLHTLARTARRTLSNARLEVYVLCQTCRRTCSISCSESYLPAAQAPNSILTPAHKASQWQASVSRIPGTRDSPSRTPRVLTLRRLAAVCATRRRRRRPAPPPLLLHL
eukprot:3321913-Pleurochrysis_carterae.AAC.1